MCQVSNSMPNSINKACIHNSMHQARHFMWVQPDDSTNVLSVGYCAPATSGSMAETGVVAAWTQKKLPAPLSFFPLSTDLQSATLPGYIGTNMGASFVGDSSFGSVLSCDKVTLCSPANGVLPPL